MDYLQEVLFGEKIAISSHLLSLSQNIQLNEAERVLAEFYANNQNVLDAAYKVSTKSGIKTTIKILSTQELPVGNTDARIFLLSPQRATDPAVIAEIGRKTRELLLKCKVSDLANSGYCVNPVLDPEFSVDTAKKVFGPLSALQSSSTIKPTASAQPPPVKPALEIKKEETKVPKSEIKSERLPTKITTNEAKKLQSNPAENNKKHSRSDKPKQQFNSFFTKIDKTEALKQARKSSVTPVHESIVIGDQANIIDNEESHIAGEGPSDVNLKNNQLKNLEKLYDDDNGKNVVAGSTRDNENDSKVLSESENDQADEEPMDVDMDMNMSMEPILEEPDDLSIQISKHKPHAAFSTEVAQAPEKTSDKPLEDAYQDALEKVPEKTSKEDKPQKRTRRVLKTIIRKDEEGFDVRQKVYVDEEVSDTESASGDGNLPQKQSLADNIPLEKNSNRLDEHTAIKRPGENEKPLESQKTERKKRAPPTIKKGNQSSLYSFFTQR